ncbi:MAG TPA: NADH:flavin oxidoreductase [Acidimicrobiales bacterium]|nr:NADH:flavin oxidoreductase [Acidimicrobiales bacterium]
MTSPFAPAQLGPITLRNRVIKAATFEGVMPRGAVTQELIDYHLAVARGGVGLTTLAYCAVSMNGRVSPHTLVFTESLIPDLTRFTAAIHETGAKTSAQLGHAGLVAQANSRRYPTTAPSTRISLPAKGRVRGASLSELDAIVEDFGRAARVAVASGFDAIEVHLGHNYLLSSFMSPNLNRRRDDYGGSIENRARFPRRVVTAVREAVGDAPVAVVAKFNMDDGVAKGLHPDESLQFAQLLEADGHLDALVLTGGSSLLNGMYFFRGDVPMKEFAATQGRLIGFGMKFYGRRIFPKLPFEEAFFLPMARQFRSELKMPLVLLGGINKADTIYSAMDEGFGFVAMARALLREPDLVDRFAAGEATRGVCSHCNKCMPTIYSGTHCVERV